MATGIVKAGQTAPEAVATLLIGRINEIGELLSANAFSTLPLELLFL